jgi:cell division protein ZapE
VSPKAVGGDALRAAYSATVSAAGFTADPAQREVLDALVDLQDRLRRERSLHRGLTRVLRWRPIGAASPAVRGTYLWGPPGRGKTLLMDLFHSTLPVAGKRQHFHHFMRDVHARLGKLRRRAHPLTAVAEEFAREAPVICLDELQVTDIGDAMILNGLLAALLQRGVCLVITSNQHPDELYAGGLQRERFLPAIDLLKSQLDVRSLDGGTDFRLRDLAQAEVWLPSADPATHLRLSALFDRLAGMQPSRPRVTLTVNGRRLHVVRQSPDALWMTFAVLCEGPRGQADYIELARTFPAVVVSDVPVLGAQRDDAARRFIGLIDELYDRGVKLIVSAAAEPADLYRGTRLAEAFRRTVSRLIEMRSTDYLARAHRTDG